MTPKDCSCSVEKCDIFDFMAKYVGLSVLHPGGFESTTKMIEKSRNNGWNDLFLKSGAKNLNTEIFTMHFGGFTGMIKDEGIRNSIRVIIKYMTDPKVRKRMNTMNKFFKDHEDVFGYGIYTMTKEGPYAA